MSKATRKVEYFSQDDISLALDTIWDDFQIRSTYEQIFLELYANSRGKTRHHRPTWFERSLLGYTDNSMFKGRGYLSPEELKSRFIDSMAPALSKAFTILAKSRAGYADDELFQPTMKISECDDWNFRAEFRPSRHAQVRIIHTCKSPHECRKIAEAFLQSEGLGKDAVMWIG